MTLPEILLTLVAVLIAHAWGLALIEVMEAMR